MSCLRQWLPPPHTDILQQQTSCPQNCFDGRCLRPTKKTSSFFSRIKPPPNLGSLVWLHGEAWSHMGQVGLRNIDYLPSVSTWKTWRTSLPWSFATPDFRFQKTQQFPVLWPLQTDPLPEINEVILVEFVSINDAVKKKRKKRYTVLKVKITSPNCTSRSKEFKGWGKSSLSKR